MKKVLSILLSVMLILSTMTCLMLVPATAVTVGTVSSADGGYLVKNEDGTTTAKPYYGNTFVAWYNEADEVVSYNTTIGAVEENVVAKFNNYNLIPNGNFEDADISAYSTDFTAATGAVTFEVKDVPGTNAGHGANALYVDTSKLLSTAMSHSLNLPKVTVDKNTEYVLRYSVYAEPYEGSNAVHTTFQSEAAKVYYEATSGKKYTNYDYECIVPSYSYLWGAEQANGARAKYSGWCYGGYQNNTSKLTGPNTHFSVGVGAGKWIDVVVIFNTGEDITMFAEGEDTGVMWFNIGYGYDAKAEVDAGFGVGVDRTPNFYVDNISLTKVADTAKTQMTVTSDANGSVSGPAVANRGVFEMHRFDGGTHGEADATQWYVGGANHAQMVTNGGVYTATPAEGYTFIKWVDANGNTVSTKATDFLANDGTVKAVFAKGVAAADGGYLIDNGDGTVTAKPYYGNTFLGWYDADDNLLTGGEWDTLTVTKEKALGVTAKFNVYNMIVDGSFEANNGDATDFLSLVHPNITEFSVQGAPSSSNAGHGSNALYVATDKGVSTAMCYTVKVPVTLKKNTDYVFKFSYWMTGKKAGGTVDTTDAIARVCLMADKGYKNSYTPNGIFPKFSLAWGAEKADASTITPGGWCYKGNENTNFMSITTHGNVGTGIGKWVEVYVTFNSGEDLSVFDADSDTASCHFTIGGTYDSQDGVDNSSNFYVDNIVFSEAAAAANAGISVSATEGGKVTGPAVAQKPNNYTYHYNTAGGAKGESSATWASGDAKYSNIVTNTGSYTATAEKDYAFLGWYVGNTLISTEPTTDIYVEGPVVAKFAKGLGYTDGGYLKDNGDGTVTAVAYYGNTFAGWYKDGQKLSGGEYDTFTVAKEDQYGVSAVFNNYNQMVDGNFESGDPNGADFYNTLAYSASPIFKNNSVVELPANIANANHGSYALWCEPKASATASDYAASGRLVRIPLSLEAGKEYALTFSYYIPGVPTKPDGTELHANAWTQTSGATLSGDFIATRWTKYWKAETEAVPAGWCGHTHENANLSVSQRVRWAGDRAYKYNRWVEVYVLFTAQNTEEAYFDFGILNNCVTGFYMDNISVTEAANAHSTVITATAAAGGTVTQNETAIMKFDHAAKNGSMSCDLDKYADYHIAGTTRYSNIAYRTYTAVANAGYKFAGWQNAAGEIVSTNVTETFQVEGAYTAVFVAAPKAAKGGYLVENSDGTVTAKAYYGNVFTGWSNGLTDATVKFDDVMGETANFTVNNWVVDGSFEAGKAQINDGVVGNAACDTFAQLGGNANILMSIEDAPGTNYGHGDKALYVDYNGYNYSGQNTNSYVLRTQNFPVEAGKKYIFRTSVYMNMQPSGSAPSVTVRIHGSSSYANSWTNSYVPSKYTAYFNHEKADGTIGNYYTGYRINGGVNATAWGGTMSTNIFGHEGWYDIIYMFEASANENVFFSLGSGNGDSSTNFYVDNVSFAEATTVDPNANVTATPGGNVYASEQLVGSYKFYNTGAAGKADEGIEKYDSLYSIDDTTYYYSPVVVNSYEAVANKGMEFAGWTKDGVAFGDNAKIEIAGKGDYVAKFDSIAQNDGLEGGNPNDVASAGNGTTLEYATYTEEQKAMLGYDAAQMGDTYLKVTNTGDSHVDFSVPVSLKAGVRYLVHYKFMVISSDVADPTVEWTEENPVGPEQTSRVDFRTTIEANGWASFDAWAGKMTIAGPNGTAGYTKAVEDEDMNWYTSGWFVPANQERFGTDIVDVYYDITATEDAVAYITFGQWAGGEFGVDSFTVTEVADMAPTMIGATFNPTVDKNADAAMYVTRVDVPSFVAIGKVETFMGVASELGDNTNFNSETANVTTASLSAYKGTGFLTAPGSTDAFRAGDFYTTFNGASTTAQKVKFSVRSEISITDCYGHDLGIVLGTDNVYSRSINQIKRLLAKSLGADSATYNNADVAVAWQYVLDNSPAQ